jgi:TatD DNase family protein
LENCSGDLYLVDAHTHIQPDEEEAARRLAQQGLWQLVAATNPDECARIAALASSESRIIFTAGLHPWYSAAHSPDTMDDWLQQAPIIGEIGLDTVWTDAPLEQQRVAFLYQLQRAVVLQKPVILHTKGAEAEILTWLERYTPPLVIVHWYSGPAELLPGYQALGCYFTLGPDLEQNPAQQAVCRQVAPDRLLTETDGSGAVAWATGCPSLLQDTPQVLRRILNTAARTRGIAPEELQAAVQRNLLRLLGI